ncbi:hypothetical protein [Lysinibacillus sphaericus]|uniref:hypothetical protein n=1 Tax=Lysinibacillus sphaericus TaxID=1421 RepID=UPI003D0195BC
MKKFLSALMSSTLVISTLAFAAPIQKASASELDYGSEKFQIIEDTAEKSEYILKVNGNDIRYVETVTKIDENTSEIETKAFNEETNELLQHFSTVVEEDKIVEQEVVSFKELPHQEESVLFNNNADFAPLAAKANITSNKSLVTVLAISYKTNHNTNIGYADYADLKTRSVNITTASAKDRNAYNNYTQNVDSLRATENGTLAGWLISAFSGGGLTVGALLSWKTAQVILKNIAGPVAIAANAWALGQWFYYYNNCVNGFYDIPKK